MPVRADEAVAALAVRAGVARGAPQRVVVPSLLRLVEQLVDHDGLHRRAIGRGAQIRQQADLVVQERRLVHAAGGGVGGAAGSMGRGAAATIQLRHPDGLAALNKWWPLTPIAMGAELVVTPAASSSSANMLSRKRVAAELPPWYILDSVCVWALDTRAHTTNFCAACWVGCLGSSAVQRGSRVRRLLRVQYSRALQ